jgi:hypothetical protein
LQKSGSPVVNRWLFVHGFGVATINGGAVEALWAV